MKFVVQRVSNANVTVEGIEIGKIGKGFLVLIGIGNNDNHAVADKMLKKLLSLRIFEDENGKTNLDITTVKGELLLISQFTLYADCKKGNRPSFTDAGNPDKAKELYEYIISSCATQIPVVQHGRFGAEMKVALVNDGPFTIVMDSNELGFF